MILENIEFIKPIILEITYSGLSLSINNLITALVRFRPVTAYVSTYTLLNVDANAC